MCIQAILPIFAVKYCIQDFTRQILQYNRIIRITAASLSQGHRCCFFYSQEKLASIAHNSTKEQLCFLFKKFSDVLDRKTKKVHHRKTSVLYKRTKTFFWMQKNIDKPTRMWYNNCTSASGLFVVPESACREIGIGCRHGGGRYTDG